MSYDLQAKELRVYHVASQGVVSLLQSEFRVNKFVSYKPTSLWVASLQVNNLIDWVNLRRFK